MAKSYRRTDLPVEFIAVKNAGHDSEPVGDDQGLAFSRNYPSEDD